MNNIPIIWKESNNKATTKINDTSSLQHKYASMQVPFAQITVYAVFVCI